MEVIELDFRLFERLDEEAYSVFEDKSLLSLSYVPDVLVCRDREAEYFAGILTRGVAENFLPPMIRVFGRTGSGKTAVVRSVLEGFSRYRGDVFRQFYVNLKSCRTVFSAGNALLSAICGRRVPVNLGLDRVFAEIWSELRALKGEGRRLFVCLVLDEVDSIFMDKHFDPSDFFYRFIRSQMYLGDPDLKICLVAITNNLSVLDDNLDARVKSSMGSEVLMFPAYTEEELREILASRAEDAFRTGVLEGGAVDRCVALVSKLFGDARRAIDLLRVSGEVASESGSDTVTEEHVEKAWDRVNRDWVSEMILDLSEIHKFILTVIAANIVSEKLVTTGTAYRSYKKSLERIGGTPLGERRFAEIINELCLMDLLDASVVSRGRYGRTKIINLQVDPETMLDTLYPKWRKQK